MLPQHRNHLSFLDRALLNLLEERARLVREAGGGGEPHLEDLLARAQGSVPAPAIRRVFAEIHEACQAKGGKR